MKTRQRKLRFGLIGCGAMGSVLAGHLLRHWSRRALWTGFCDTDGAKARALAGKLGLRVSVRSLEDTVDHADWVIEAASPAAVPAVLRRCIAKGKNALVMSSGGLAKNPSLLVQAQRKGIGLIIPSGAIAGLDAIKAARLGKIQEACIETRKSPRALAGAPYLERKELDLSRLEKETVIFEGNALDAVEGFPANINVAATLGLATGLGLKNTKVRIVADPHAQCNVHQIQVRGSSGTITARVENVPSAANPKTSELAVLAACAALDQIFSPLRIGT